MPLLPNPKYELYAQGRAKGLGPTDAFEAAGFARNTGNCQRLEKNPDVQARVAEIIGRAAERAEITHEMVLRRWWDIATADPNEVIQFRRTCCRHCFGEDGGYQWRDEAEFTKALMKAKAAEAKDLPTNEGGFGFNQTIEPNPACGQCFGEGVAQVHAPDTRKLNGAARLLYAGVKQTRDGFELKLQDQGKALENVARHLGMFVDKHEVTGKDGGPIEVADMSDTEKARRIAFALARGAKQAETSH